MIVLLLVGNRIIIVCIGSILATAASFMAEGMFGLDPGDSFLGQAAPQAVGFGCLRWDVAAWAVTCLPG